MKLEDIPFSVAVRLLKRIRVAFETDDYEALDELSREYPNLLSTSLEEIFSPFQEDVEDIVEFGVELDTIHSTLGALILRS